MSAVYAAGKFVLEVEYSDDMTFAQFKRSVCPAAAAANISPIFKNMDLKFYRKPCPGKP